MIEPIAPQSLQLKVLLRDVHPAVWRRVTLSDALSIADLHRVIQSLLGWDDDHLHRFCIQGREYRIAYAGGLGFDEDAAVVSATRRMTGFERTVVNVALRQAFAATGSSHDPDGDTSRSHR